ncbi:Ead domain protein [Klebsiella pneumoniae]|nr:Ead domain protein [Klebsiella pneumoniae]
MTDITELAQREKFEAWWEREYKHLESSKYTDAVPHIKYGFWMAYQAGGAELVEALEKAQTINAAAEKLVRCKGRYHSEQNYRALAALFGVTTPDLPPLDSESRIVTVSKSDIFNVPGGETYVGGEMISVDTLRLYLAEHGIKWEAE